MRVSVTAQTKWQWLGIVGPPNPDRSALMSNTGICHCGKTVYCIQGELPDKLTKCTCAFCLKRGTLLAYYEPVQFQATAPATDDATFRWNTMQVGHYICQVCGCAHIH
jgi:hypothetical protein